MKINKYFDFMSESKLTLLLEANMTYSNKFADILSKLKSPIAKQILDLRGKDVDVITNYIDLTDKDDTIAFIPDNRAKTMPTKVVENGLTYHGLTEMSKMKYPNLYEKEIRTPEDGQVGIIVRELTVEEINSVHRSIAWQNKYNQGITIIQFRFTDSEGEADILIENTGLSVDLSSITKSEIKVGRFTRRLLDKAGIKPSDKEIEDFVNQYRSRFEIEKDVFRLFEVVSGPDIKKWYYQGMYSQTLMSGTLWQSCMRYDKCQNYFSIYTSNPNQVSLIILKDADPNEVEIVDEITGETTTKAEESLIRGRALLWTDIKGRKFMDRVYFTKESDVELFKQYAIKNEWFYKIRQENDESTPLAFNGEALEGEDNTVTVKLDHGGDFRRYPYLDTLKYYEPYKNTLSNSDSINFEYKLEDTDGGNGGCEVCGGSGRVECGDCGGDGTQTCNECDGRRKLDCDNCEGSGNIEDSEGNEKECPECRGSGKNNCDNCNGSGEEECENCGGDGEVDCYECT